MVNVTSFYIVFNRLIHNFIFISYEKFIKVIYNKKCYIINNNNFIKHKKLFQIYFLSLIATKNSNSLEIDMYLGDDDICDIEFIYGSLSRHYNNEMNKFNDNYSFSPLTKYQFKNPLRTKEPVRETSMRKQNKLIKTINYDLYGFEPVPIIDEFIYK